jgi:hypothetical protein
VYYIHICIVLIYCFNHISAEIIHVLITFKCILLQTSLLQSYRGRDRAHALDKMMKKVITDEIVSKYRSLGRRRKLPFPLKTTTILSIKSKTSQSTIADKFIFQHSLQLYNGTFWILILYSGNTQVNIVLFLIESLSDSFREMKVCE